MDPVLSPSALNRATLDRRLLLDRPIPGVVEHVGGLQAQTQVPPRGLWDRSGPIAHTSAEA